MTRNAVLSGLGTWVPPHVVTNDMLATELDTSDEWIRTRTGIGRRHVASPGMSTGHLAAQAARRALKSAGAERVDVVVVATSTPDRPCPATAPVVASELGLTGVGAFDVSAVCTGFVYGLAAAAGLIGTGIADSALVVGADTFSTILDPGDRTTRVIFGDGAGAAVLRAGDRREDGALRGFDLGSDGSGVDLIGVRAGGSEQRLAEAEPAPGDHYFRMDGPQVFTRAVRHMAGSVRTVLDAASLTPDQLDHLVPHQANVRILDTCARQLGLPEDRVVKNIGQVGNTVAASIPLALASRAEQGLLAPGQSLVLTGFGGGLTWGSALLTWPDAMEVVTQ